MELELNQEHINYYEKVLDSTLVQEETQEAIVPDSFPDILHIIDTEGQISVKERNVQDGTVTLVGAVDVWVIYHPDGENDICRMEVHLPFVVRINAPGLDETGQCIVNCWLHNVDTRILNPRKILIRADIGTGIQAYQPRELILNTGIDGDESSGIQQLTAQKTIYITSSVKEKRFTLSDELRLPSGPSGTALLLGAHATARCNESKIIGNKLIFKGEVDFQILYHVNNDVCSARFPLGFSQIMDISGSGEEADCMVEMCLIGLEYTLSGDEMRTLSVTAELLGQAVICDPYPVTLLQDVYSTVCQMKANQTVFTFEQLLENAVRLQNVREILETDTPVKSVINCQLSLPGVSQKREGEQLLVSSNVHLSLLYLDAQDLLQSLHRTLPVSGGLDLPANSRCQCRCVCPGEVYASPAVGGIEVRFPLEFHCKIIGNQSVPGITLVCPGDTTEGENTHHPSVVLRMAEDHERLWDIAKAYRTTQEQIIKANQLESDSIPAGHMLLIPTAH